MIHRSHVISAIKWLKEHNSHYRDIKLNEHCYSDIASRELSVQLDESDNHITMNEEASACRLLILFEFNIATRFLYNRTHFFLEHKLLPVQLTWLHLV